MYVGFGIFHQKLITIQSPVTGYAPRRIQDTILSHVGFKEFPMPCFFSCNSHFTIKVLGCYKKWSCRCAEFRGSRAIGLYDIDY